MFASLNAFILEEVRRATGLDRIHQFPVHLQKSERGDKVFAGQAEGIFHGSVGCSKNDKTIGRTSFPYLLVAEGITDPSSLKINVGRCPLPFSPFFSRIRASFQKYPSVDP
jgi:hypothetical protein